MAERNDITEIRERIDMLELVGAKVQLKRSGKNWKGLCPFHTEKTPSFYVYPDSGNYVCFSCGEKGDAFTWLQKTEGMDFPDALEQLAARTGVTLQRGAVRDPGRDEERERFYAINEEAATFFASILLNSPVGEAGRRYVAERGLTRETIERFALGFAPDSWDALLKHLVSHGHREELLAEVGLLTERDDGRRYDRFRGRLIFPIRNRDGKIVGFGGRALGDARPKYLNTAQTTIFDKSANLYAIDLAKEAIRKSDTAVIVEGYIDAIMAHQVGHANVVASMGTALTEAQAKLLNRLAKRFVIALDADVAGQAAIERGQETVRNAAEMSLVASTDAIRASSASGNNLLTMEGAKQGLRFERQLNTEILVLQIPEGKDPDEFLRARPNDWPALIQKAEPLVDFMMKVVIGPLNLSDPKAKSAAVGQLAPLIRELPDSIQQDHYKSLLARMLHLSEEVVASEIRRLGLVRPTRGGAQGSGPTQASAEPAPVERRGPSREDHLLTLLLTHPDAAHELAAEIEPDDFTDAADRAVWTITRPTVSADPRLQTADLLTAIGDPALRESVQKLITIPSTRPTAVPGPVRQEIRNTLKLLRQEANKAQIQQLQGAIGEAAQEGDVEAVRALMEQLPVLYERLRTFDPPTSPYFRDTRTVTDKR